MSQQLTMTRVRSLVRRGAVVLGTTAVGIGVLAGPASAATHDWSGVAECESSGNWSINTGNGYYGGLQFSRGTWKANGGGQYASTANKASKSEQIRIAEKVLRSQGTGAWPTCGKKSGSSKHYKGTHVGGSTHKSHRSSAAPKSHRTSSAPHKVTRSTTVKTTGKVYVVRSGDTLSAIATKNHVKGGWHTLYQLNRGIITNPNRIFPGQRVAL
jgi:LysM repeat protein